MNKVNIKELLLKNLNNNIITINQVETIIENNLEVKNINNIIKDILDETFIFKPIPLPNDYNTSVIYILK